MNQRIRELAIQVELNATLLFNSEKLEKFAELIVRECMDVVRHINQDYDGGSTTVNAADEIKEHFGIKE